MDPEFRDDGTVVCQIHGLRYDPQLTDGCIRCPRPAGSTRKSTMPRPPGAAPRSPSQAPRNGSAPPPRMFVSDVPPAPPNRGSFAPAAVGRPGPSIPFDPDLLGGGSGPGGPQITILEAPRRHQSRRGVVLGIGALFLGGVGAAAWFLRPQGPTDWAKKVKPLEWTTPDGTKHTGSYYAATVSVSEPRPLLVLFDNFGRSAAVVARYARHAERHGWIVASPDGVGRSAGPNDNADVAGMLDYVKSTLNVDASKPMLGGFDVAGECAYRLAALQPEAYGGAIVECSSDATWLNVGGFAVAGTAFYLFSRTGDKMRDGMLVMKDEMESHGMRVTYQELPGGHDPMSGEDLEDAFLWLDGVHG